MVAIQRGTDRFAKLGAGVIVHARGPLFQNDLKLGLYLILAQFEIGHAVGFKLHHCLEMLLGDALEISGVVLCGEGVFLAAHGRDDLGEFPVRVRRRSLEHQVLEEMGNAGLARFLIRRADLVPDHMGDDRGAMIGDNHDLQAIGEFEGGEIGPQFRQVSKGRPERFRKG